MSTQVFIAVSCVPVVSFGVSVVSMVPVVSSHCFGGFVPVVPFRVLVHDYLTKVKQLISDETKLKKLTENPTKSREQSLICYLRQLKRDHLIDDYTFQKVLPNGSTHGVLYGLPKFHKTGCPFRPIVSSTNTYNYNLAS